MTQLLAAGPLLNDKQNANNPGTGDKTPDAGQLFVKWDDFTPNRKRRIFEMLTKIGQKLTIVYQSPLRKNGITSSVSAFNSATGRCVRINYVSAHLCEVELIGVG